MSRFNAGAFGTELCVVLEGTHDEYNKCEDDRKRTKMRIVEIKVGGAISYQLANTWCNQIAAQLNERDAASVAVARLTG
jgi:hypothetical protein